jgi:hypothetical protein
VDSERFFRRYKSDPAFRKRAEKRMARELVESVLTSAVALGHVSVKGKSAEQTMEEFRKYLSIKRIRSSRFLFAIDHTDTLRALGREFLKKGNLWIALVMYATWVEHTLNHLIFIGVQRRGFNDVTVKRIIRDVPFYGKLSWLLPVLGFRRLHPKHGEALRALAEKRNEFLHYKWPYRENHSNAEIKSLLAQADKALQYLAQYESRQTLQGRKSHIVNAARP